MGVFQGIVPPLMTENSLSDISSSNFIEMGGSRVAEEVGMKTFVYTNLIYHGAKDVL